MFLPISGWKGKAVPFEFSECAFCNCSVHSHTESYAGKQSHLSMSDTHWWALQVIGTHYKQSTRVDVRITETVYTLGRVTFLSSFVGFESKASHVLGKFYHNHRPSPFALVVLRQVAKLLLWSFNFLSSHIYLELVILHLSFPSVANIGVCHQTWFWDLYNKQMKWRKQDNTCKTT